MCFSGYSHSFFVYRSVDEDIVCTEVLSYPFIIWILFLFLYKPRVHIDMIVISCVVIASWQKSCKKQPWAVKIIQLRKGHINLSPRLTKTHMVLITSMVYTKSYKITRNRMSPKISKSLYHLSKNGLPKAFYNTHEYHQPSKHTIMTILTYPWWIVYQTTA